jgi:glycosyltransferase involved in cell wall biosynthesis
MCYKIGVLSQYLSHTTEVNLLFVSIAFPPKNDPECLQTAKYYKYLSKQLNSIEVITSKNPTLNMPVDISLNKYLNAASVIHYIKLFETKISNYFFRKIKLSFLSKPDAKFSFHLQYRKALSQLNKKPDVLYSRSFPLSSTMMAYKIRQQTNIPWVLHLSDPWTLSPLHHYTEQEKKYNEAWEKKCFEAASKICFTSESTIAVYKNKYPQWDQKFEYSPNVYDPDDFVTKPLIQTGKLKIVYTGGLTQERGPQYILDPLKSLFDKDPTIIDYLEVIFAGDMDRANKAIFHTYELPFVKHIGQLPYTEAIALQRQAHLLFVIDNPITKPEFAMFFPSKLLDYMMAQRRIFAITTSNSSTYKFLEKLHYQSFNHSETEKTADYIRFCLQQWKDKSYDYFLQPELLEEFSAETQAKKLVSLFKQLV